MKYSREISDPHENAIRMRFREIGVDFVVRDKSSGSARQDGDGMSEHFMLSCKFRTQKGFSLTRQDYLHDVQQAARFRRTPIWAMRNQDGQDVIMMRMEDFLRILAAVDDLKDKE